MIKVFVSYRRDDSRHQAGRLFDHLVEQFGDEHVFRDVDSIPLGLDFRNILTERVAGCDVLLAVIGDEWLSIAGPSGIRRLDEPNDFVRFEIEAALSRSIPVIPVLVGNSPVPKAEELPVSLRDLAYRQSRRVRSDPDFHHDVECLVRGIEDVVTERTAVAPTRRPHWVWPSVIFGVLVLGLLAARLGGAFKVKTLDRVVGVDNVPNESDPVATKPTNESTLGRDKTVPPIAATASRSDQERIQGRWHPIAAVNATKAAKKALPRNFDYVFHGRDFTVHMLDRGREYHGTFSLNEDHNPKWIDLVGTNLEGQHFESLGIYEFDGEFLKICFTTRHETSDNQVKRPDSFKVEAGTGRFFRRYRRTGDR